jgi:LacI family transcriptional regulator
VDNRVAGRTAGQILGMLTAGRAGSVAVFYGSRAFHGHQEREAGFCAYLGEFHSNLRLLPSMETGENSRRLCAAMATLLRTEPQLIGVYCVGAGRKGIVEALDAHGASRRPFILMHDLTESSRSWLVDDKIDAVIDQNARLVGEQAVIRLLGAIATSKVALPFKNIEPRIILRENIPAGRLVT